ncbi:MAG TPA: HYR domain-containing protein, partial [Flavisolibacter sp.]|nr:HYR domain-containing protein [Flavisolibacter sp.]
TASQVNNGSSDNCAIATDGYALDKTVFDCSNVGANTVTLTVRDASGNSAGALATVTVVDPIAPTFTIPSSHGVNLGSGCSIVVPDLVTGLSGSDNCGNVTFTQLPVAGSSLSSSHSQTHTITITANDGHGNTTSGNVTLTAKDQTFPLLTPPAAVTVNTDNGKCSASAVALGIPSYSDNCPGTTVANDAPATYQKGVTSITWTATDAAGNTQTATQTVTVTDNEKPVLTCPTVPVQCYVSSGTYTVPLLTATDNCGIASITFAITGSTTRNGSGTNAGGSFNEGSSVITWTVVDGSGNSSTCTTTVVINPRLTSLIPDVYAVNPGGSANTLYKGYGPTSLTLNASVSGGTGPYSYKWTVGSSAGQGISTSPSLTESPTATTMYYFNVKDAYGCSAPLMTRTIEVVDVRCGPRLDKVTVCVLQKGVPTTSCVIQNSVQGSLSNGGYLGSCLVSAATTKIRKVEIANEVSTPELSMSVLPNPSPSSFQLQIRSRNESPVTIRVISGLGVVIETRRGIGSNGTISIGSSYRPGVYYVEAAQDGKRVTQKLIKLSE